MIAGWVISHAPSLFRAVGRELYAFGRMAFAQLFEGSPLAPDRITALRPVILIPGSSGSDTYLHPLTDYLRSVEAIGPVYTISYAQDSMESGMANLTAKVREIIDQYADQDLPLESIDLVGHSQGALIACEYAFVHQPELPVHQVVSLAGRLKDSPSRLRPYCYEFLAPHLESIHTTLLRDRIANLHTAAAEWDWLVPIDSVHLAYGQQRTFLGTSHAHLALLPEAHAWVANLLSA